MKIEVKVSRKPANWCFGCGLGMAGLGITRAIRNDIKPAQNVAARLEKLNLRKEADDLLDKARQGQPMFA